MFQCASVPGGVCFLAYPFISLYFTKPVFYKYLKVLTGEKESRPVKENIGLTSCGENSGSSVKHSNSCNQLVGPMCPSKGHIFDYWSTVLRF